jgi:hypothetical protein
VFTLCSAASHDAFMALARNPMSTYFVVFYKTRDRDQGAKSDRETQSRLFLFLLPGQTLYLVLSGNSRRTVKRCKHESCAVFATEQDCSLTRAKFSFETGR